MDRYGRNYDYGMRGYRQTAGALWRGRPPRDGYDASYPRLGDERGFGRNDRPNRVTARYNLDYVTGEPRRLERNYYMYTGDRMDRMGDERYYRRPYLTIGGTRTMRGASPPIGYDYPYYGPSYGGRYPDEL